MDESDTQTGADVAEMYFGDDDLQPGDLVSIDPLQNIKVNKALESDGSRVIGIVSTQPGIILDDGYAQGLSFFPIALTGRVQVRMASDSEAVSQGDLIGASEIPGKGKKVNGGYIIGRALEAWTPGSGQEVVKVFVNPIYVSSDIQLTGIDGLKVVADETDPLNQILTDANNNQVTNLSGFVSFVSENIKAGFIEVASLVSPSIKTKQIETFDGEKDLAIKIGDENSTQESGFGKLLIQNNQGETVASVDEQGNADFAGEVTSESLTTNDATVSGELRAGKIYAEEIVGLDAKFADIAGSSYTGITREEIEEVLKAAESDQDLLNNAGNWEISTATGSAALNELALENLYVTGTTALDSLSVRESIVVGSDLVISSLISDIQNLTSIDTINAPLSIQSSGAQPLEIMAGLVRIDTQGNVNIAGSLAVEGTVSAKSLTLSADSEHTTGFGNLLSVVNSLDEEVAAISATGSAEFRDVTADEFAVREDPTATESATLAGNIFETSATAGTAKIGAGSQEITIKNPKIGLDSLVFVTPTSSTTSVLYVKEQADGSILVGFDSPTTSDVSFNWWIVQVDKHANAQ
jgi:hypothetical protein